MKKLFDLLFPKWQIIQIGDEYSVRKVSLFGESRIDSGGYVWHKSRYWVSYCLMSKEEAEKTYQLIHPTVIK